MIINGYEVIKNLGSGNFGTTYLVEKNKATYALKLIRSNMLDHNTFDSKRIEREIKILKEVSSDNVAKYVDDGVFHDGDENYRFIVMEYAEGINLETFLQEAKECLPSYDAARLAYNIFEAVHDIHKSNIIHRDLKPGNIILTDKDSLTVKIIDFGISKLIDASTLTTTGQGMGTFAYMPPEQLTSAKDIDYRADYYSIAVMMYEFLSGERPFIMSNQLEAMNKILHEKPTPVINKKTNIPIRFSNLIETLLEKEPYKRNINISEILSILEGLKSQRIERKIEYTYSREKLEFIPLAQNNDSKALSEFSLSEGLDGALFNAPLLLSTSKRYDEIKNNGKSRLIIDPYTHTLAYSAFTTKVTYKKLPYIISNMRKETPKDFLNPLAIQERSKKSIDLQLSYKPNILLSPYHFYDSVKSDWMIVDHNVYKEAKNYLNKLNINIPLYYGISFDIEKFEDESDLENLVNFITSAQPDGYYLQIAGNFESLNSNHYYIYAKLVKMLSFSEKEIILSRINDFSLGLLALGANTIVTSLGQGDNFKEDFLNRDTTGGAQRRYYVEDLLGLQNKNIMEDILSTNVGKELLCSCKFCNNSSNIDKLLSFENLIKHHIFIRKKQLEEFSTLTNDERLNLFIKKVDNAEIITQKILKEKKIKNFSFKHFDVWKEVIINVYNLDSPKISNI